MRKYAFLLNNKISKIDSLSETEFLEVSKQFECGIDIQDASPQPQVGWELEGNALVDRSAVGLTQEQIFEIQCNKQRVFGMALVLSAIDRIGARNLNLVSEGVPVNVMAIVSSMQGTGALLNGGALKTARTVIVSMEPSYPLYVDILTDIKNQITDFLVSNGHE